MRQFVCGCGHSSSHCIWRTSWKLSDEGMDWSVCQRETCPVECTYQLWRRIERLSGNKPCLHPPMPRHQMPDHPVCRRQRVSTIRKRHKRTREYACCRGTQRKGWRALVWWSGNENPSGRAYRKPEAGGYRSGSRRAHERMVTKNSRKYGKDATGESLPPSGQPFILFGRYNMVQGLCKADWHVCTFHNKQCAVCRLAGSRRIPCTAQGNPAQ